MSRLTAALIGFLIGVLFTLFATHDTTQETRIIECEYRITDPACMP